MDAINANRAPGAPAAAVAAKPAATVTPPATTGAPTSRPPRKWTATRLLPLIGPLALFVVWDLVVRLQLVSPVLLLSLIHI